MTKRIFHIGCGLVGSLIAEELSRDYSVTVMDTSGERLASLKKTVPSIKTINAVDGVRQIKEVLSEGYDIVTGAVNGKFAFETAKAVLESGTSYCDISSHDPNSDFESLQKTAESNGVFYIPEVGIAPGMTNFVVGRGASLLDEVENVKIYVGGFPENPKPPFHYQATWSPLDVIEEYDQHVRVVRDGKVKILRALDGLHQIDFEPLGKLEAFFTEGLGTLVTTIKAKNMSEMTTRWPGHAAQMRMLRDMGLFEEKAIKLGGVELIPRKVIADILMPMWKMEPEKGDRDLLAWRVIVEGKKGNEMVSYTWELLDRFDEKTMRTSMSRCTGLTCAIFARAAMEGKVRRVGIASPELLACDDDLYEFIMAEQSKRGFKYREEVKKVMTTSY